ncbi:MAG: AMP-binding protein [Propionibacteriales bacterium]|nr:AMP-binding protein [Propionibacteriales bacterium]
MMARTNLAELAAEAAASRPEHTAIVDAHRRLSWSELDAEVSAVARGLDALGVVAGFRIALMLPNRVEFVTTYLGILRAGLVAIPLNPASATGELVRVLADSGTRAVVCDASTVTQVRAAVTGLAEALEGADEELRARSSVPRVVVVGVPPLEEERAYADLVSGSGPQPASPRDPEALAVLLYTSGTSGRPRAAMLSHRALLANIEQAGDLEPPAMVPDDVVLGVLPMFHVYGLNAVLGQVLLQAATLILVGRFDPESTLAVVEQEGVTNLPVAPPVLTAWADRDDLRERVRSVRAVTCGASPLAVETHTRFEEATGVTVQQGYGLTEAAPVVTSTLASPQPKPGSVGRPLENVEVRIVDADGQDVHDQDAGEIWVRGANLFSGYWPDGEEGPDADGWYPTGDVGYLDADGDLFLVDRIKEIVIVRGFNVYPFETEQVIAEVDEVAEVAVIGVDDERAGEAVVAYVVPEPHAGLPEDRLAAMIRDHCAARLAEFKQPRDIRVVDELPHSVTGKVAKGRLRDTERRREMGLA